MSPDSLYLQHVALLLVLELDAFDAGTHAKEIQFDTVNFYLGIQLFGKRIRSQANQLVLYITAVGNNDRYQDQNGYDGSHDLQGEAYAFRELQHESNDICGQIYIKKWKSQKILGKSFGHYIKTSYFCSQNQLISHHCNLIHEVHLVTR